jgi:7-carboxy-7-deazaguanine synthase
VTARAFISEVFTSIQGEGALAGAKQLFVRFAGCNISCAYCDTPRARERENFGAYEKSPGAGPNVLFPNPVDARKLARIAADSMAGAEGSYHSISITGGEPLVQAEFLEEWLPLVRKKRPVFLETNGTLPKEAARLAHMVDFVSMDIKMPSAAKCGPFWDLHRDFIRACLKRNLSVKLTVSPEVDDYEVSKAAILVSKLSKVVPVFIQPASGGKSIGVEKLLAMHDTCARFLANVRVLPQVHKTLGIR